MKALTNFKNGTRRDDRDEGFSQLVYRGGCNAGAIIVVKFSLNHSQGANISLRIISQIFLSTSFRPADANVEDAMWMWSTFSHTHIVHREQVTLKVS
jgi:hypothetical protein